MLGLCLVFANDSFSLIFLSFFILIILLIWKVFFYIFSVHKTPTEVVGKVGTTGKYFGKGGII